MKSWLLLFLVSVVTSKEELQTTSKYILPRPRLFKKPHFVTLGTVTETSTLTVVSTIETIGVCARLVNVTGPCRRKRGMWVEEPIVLTFDEDMDQLDQLYEPSQVFRMETTALPSVEIVESEGRTNNNRLITDAVIGPSHDYGVAAGDSDKPESRLWVKGLLNYVLKRLNFISVVIITKLTVTSTTYDVITTSNRTFYVQLCTPSPFPFPLCSKRK